MAGNDKATPQEARIAYIKELGRKMGLYNIDKKGLAKKFNCHERSIYRDIEEIYRRGLDGDIVDKVKVELKDISYAQFEKLHSQLLKTTDPKNIAAISKAIDSAKQSITDFLEKFGVKEKIADKVENYTTIEVDAKDKEAMIDEILNETNDKK